MCICKVVEIENLTKTYEKGSVKALNGVNLTIEQGEFVAIMGSFGSGKSTLLNIFLYLGLVFHEGSELLFFFIYNYF